jgi:hypothetical protein
MANFRVTFFFESVQTSRVGTDSALGWTETWYASSETDTIESIIRHIQVLKYMDKRRALLDSIYRIAFVRVSDESFPGRVKIRTIQGGEGLIEDAAHKGQVQCALLVDFMRLPAVANERVHHRRFLLRALPAAIIQGNVPNDQAEVWKAVITFLDYLGRGASGDDNENKALPFWQIRYQDPGEPRLSITSITVDGIRPQRLLIQPDQPAWVASSATNQGAKIKVTDVVEPGLERANRQWVLLARIAGIGPTKMVFGTARREFNPAVSAVSDLGVGFMRRQVNLYGPAHQYAIIGLRSKKTGRVFRQLRGRQRNR